MRKNIAVILAGGRGTRMKLSVSKVMAPVCNKPMLKYLLDELKSIDFMQKYIVLGEKSSQVCQILDSDIRIVVQPESRGTGDAFACACRQFANFDGSVLLLNGDGPVVSSEVLERVLNKKDAKMSIFTDFLPENNNFGRIKRCNNKITSIIEARDCSARDFAIAEKNLGIYCFDNQILQKYIYNLDCNNMQNEYYVTDLVKIFAKNHHKIVSVSKNEKDFYLPSANNLAELHIAEKIMQKHINQRLMDQGVYLVSQDNTFVDVYSTVGEYTKIYANCTIWGSKIGRNCVINPNSVIKNAILSDGVEVGSGSVIENVELIEDVAPLTYIKG